MNKKYAVSVVIPNYNGLELLKENLPPLFQALEIANINYEVIISDDSSVDSSIHFLKDQYPNIVVIESRVNRGFAPTANAGIFAAKNELVFLMNSDVRLTGDYFTPQFRYFSRTDTFGVMGRIVGLDNDKIQDAAKRQYSTGLKIGSDVNIVPEEAKELWFPSLYLSGANALLDREKLLLLGGFDELYAPFYGEDLDLCFRAWKVGWSCYYEHTSVCRHPNSVTINKYNKKKKIKSIVYRNRFIMHAIHLKGWRKIAWDAWLAGQLIVKTLSLKSAFLKGFRSFLNKRGNIEESKDKLKQLSGITGIRRSNEEVYALISRSMNDIPHHYV